MYQCVYHSRAYTYLLVDGLLVVAGLIQGCRAVRVRVDACVIPDYRRRQVSQENDVSRCFCLGITGDQHLNIVEGHSHIAHRVGKRTAEGLVVVAGLVRDAVRVCAAYTPASYPPYDSGGQLFIHARCHTIAAGVCTRYIPRCLTATLERIRTLVDGLVVVAGLSRDAVRVRVRVDACVIPDYRDCGYHETTMSRLHLLGITETNAEHWRRSCISRIVVVHLLVDGLVVVCCRSSGDADADARTLNTVAAVARVELSITAFHAAGGNCASQPECRLPLSSVLTVDPVGTTTSWQGQAVSCLAR
jgi:hypothetical protein